MKLRTAATAMAAFMIAYAPHASQAGPYIVVDEATGLVLAQRDALDPWHPASLTKLMTAYAVLHKVRSGAIAMNSPVRVSFAASQQPPSKLGLPVGTIMTIETALKVIMVKSANDVSLALAEAASGSEADFVADMNWAARTLGLGGTWFVNPHGLPEIRQVTTARDMAELSMALIREFPDKAGLFSIPEVTLGDERLRNHNRLIGRLEGVSGMKTGFICASGFNIVTRASRNGRAVTVVVLGGRTAKERDGLVAELTEEAYRTAPDPAAHPALQRMEAATPPASRPADLRDWVCEGKPLPASFADLSHPSAQPERTLEQRETLYGQWPVAPAQKLALGGAFGPNPFGFSVFEGGTPPPPIPVPIARPSRWWDKKDSPHPELPPLAEREYALGGATPVPTSRPDRQAGGDDGSQASRKVEVGTTPTTASEGEATSAGAQIQPGADRAYDAGASVVSQ